MLSELGASLDALTVVEELLRFRLVSPLSLFVGWSDHGKIELVYVGERDHVPFVSSQQNGTESLLATGEQSVTKPAEPV